MVEKPCGAGFWRKNFAEIELRAGLIIEVDDFAGSASRRTFWKSILATSAQSVERAAQRPLR